jgi:nitroreductase
MDIFEAIYKRRSIRKYKDAFVPQQVIEEILKAAMFAPSGMNEQPWQFIVIQERKTLDAIPALHPHARMCKEAPLAILVCGDLSCLLAEGLWPMGCSAAAQNLLLAAHAKGLGGVWSGVYPLEERIQGFRKLLHLPDQIVPFALLVLGYPDEKPVQPDRFKRERIHFEKW